MPKKAPAAKTKEESLSFEQAIQRLERIVGEMESAELPLEDVLAKYEEGTKLVRLCGRKLEEAEKKIELLTKKADGTAALESFTESAAADRAAPVDDEENGKLF